MSLAIIHSRASFGIEAPPVTVEVHLSLGIPSLSIVGLPETAVKESKDRVRSALINSGFEFPARRITVNLAPADLPKKEGGRFDLAIALGILIASRQVQTNIATLTQYEFAGELSLDGKLRQFSGVLPFALATKKAKRMLTLPIENAREASLVYDITILPASHLLEVCAHLNGTKILMSQQRQSIKSVTEYIGDLNDVYGQEHAKRALEIAAAGGHNLLMIGPPGVGKTMLASRLTTILPEMNDDEALETAALYSICGKKEYLSLWRTRPFRTPHHSASTVALVGGASPPQPGEISLAHNGVLFLDELLEFKRSALEALREPLESRHITISRAAYQARFPANFQLIAAMNPCPCGYYGEQYSNCNCTPDQIKRYRSRISGPFLDRLDLWVTVSSLSKNILTTDQPCGVTSAEVRKRVTQARERAVIRAPKSNAELTNQELKKFCTILPEDQKFLATVIEKLRLSARSYHRIIKVARTIADLDGEEQIQSWHLQEAVGYRRG